MRDIETPDFTQRSLFPPDVLQLTVRVGLVMSADHAQVQMEVANPETGELLALRSRPHLTGATRAAVSYAVVDMLMDAWVTVVDPEPF